MHARFHRQDSKEPLDAVVLVWDVDVQSEGRPSGVEAARVEARRWAPFQIICGFPDPAREAWVLAGFEPCDDDERVCLDRLHRDLGFSPVLHAVQLRSKEEGHPRDIKRVLRELTGGDHSREERCWTEPAIETLRTRGTSAGLAAFLDEIGACLVPLFGR